MKTKEYRAIVKTNNFVATNTKIKIVDGELFYRDTLSVCAFVILCIILIGIVLIFEDLITDRAPNKWKRLFAVNEIRAMRRVDVKLKGKKEVRAFAIAHAGDNLCYIATKEGNELYRYLYEQCVDKELDHFEYLELQKKYSQIEKQTKDNAKAALFVLLGTILLAIAVAIIIPLCTLQ